VLCGGACCFSPLPIIACSTRHLHKLALLADFKPTNPKMNEDPSNALLETKYGPVYLLKDSNLPRKTQAKRTRDRVLSYIGKDKQGEETWNIEQDMPHVASEKAQYFKTISKKSDIIFIILRDQTGKQKGLNYYIWVYNSVNIKLIKKVQSAEPRIKSPLYD